MPPQTLEKRVTTLEVEMKELRELPAHVVDLGLQIVQLRTEMRDEFSAVRNEIRAGDERTLNLIEQMRGEMRSADEEQRTEMRTADDGLRMEMRAIGERLRTEMRTLEEGLRTEMRTADESVRMEMRSLNEETLGLMRVLHEDVIGRLTLIQEHQAPPRGARGKKGPRKRSR